MLKSYVKQSLLCACFGPLGIIYSSLKAALTSTAILLVLILVFEQHSLQLLLFSIPLAIVQGLLIIHKKSQKSNIRDFRLSTYIGRVSCKITGKKPVKRDYHKALAKTRRKKKLAFFQNCALASLCLILSVLIAAPDITARIKNFTKRPANNTVADTDTYLSPEQETAHIEFTDSGIWQTTVKEGRNFSAYLKADEYQNSSDGWYRPKLTISCIDNRTELLIETSEILGPEAIEINLSLNSEKSSKNTSVKRKWNTTPDYRAAIAPAAISLARQLNKTDSIAVSYQPFGANNNTRTSSFNLKNSQPVIKMVRNYCNW